MRKRENSFVPEIFNGTLKFVVPSPLFFVTGYWGKGLRCSLALADGASRNVAAPTKLCTARGKRNLKGRIFLAIIGGYDILILLPLRGSTGRSGYLGSFAN